MQLNEIFLVDAKRTPQAKAGTTLMDVPVPHLGVELVRYLLDKHNIPNDGVDEVVFGNTGAPAKYTNIGRIIALGVGLVIRKQVRILFTVIVPMGLKPSLKDFFKLHREEQI